MIVFEVGVYTFVSINKNDTFKVENQFVYTSVVVSACDMDYACKQQYMQVKLPFLILLGSYVNP